MNEDFPDQSPDPADDFDAFTQIVSAMKGLDRDARLRLFRSIAAFFDLPIAPNTAGPPSPPSDGSEISVSAPFSEDRAAPPKNFLLEKSPNTDLERVACLAYYLTHYRDTPHFKTLDISKLNTEAAQVKFSNAAQAVDNAGKSGLIVQSTKGHKQLSAMGELYVQALPDRAAARQAVASLKRRKPRKKVGGPKRSSTK